MPHYTEPMLKEGSLNGKTIVVTGGGTGLGRAMSKYFLELGAQVVICSRKKDVIEQAAKELRDETGGQCLGIPCDVRNYEAVEAVLKQSVDEFGVVNGLVNNAAGNFISPTERLSYRAFDSVVDIVLKGSYNCSLAFGKYWIENKIKANVLSIVTTYA
ncbi:MAG: SDR family NAD(P)-dependent oxidoreductase, partial [Flavobacteriales bacterium]|nr:SDR family NAD(P)-dependent oxidoreductase [Flavobacteriales bacterium]